MRILLLAAASSIHTVRWANAFVARGHEVHLVSQQHPLSALDAKVHFHGLPHLQGTGYILNGGRIQRLVKRIAPDVVNTHYASGYGTLSLWIDRVPLVLNVWGSDVYEFPDRSPFHRMLIRRVLAHADRIVSTSKVMAERTRVIHSGGAAVEVVPFGVDTDRFGPEGVSARSGLVTIGTVKTLEPVYGVDRLVAAFIALAQQKDMEHVRLRIVGGGSLLEALQRQVTSAGLAERVTFTGAVTHDQVPAELAKLDIYVALSRSESFGVAVIEASACGLPVVVSDVGGLPEVVEDGVSGLVVTNGDVFLATNALTMLVHDPDRRERMGRMGRARVLANYAWDACVDLQLGILSNAAKQQRS
jgi:L-malate glycosyltransferase